MNDGEKNMQSDQDQRREKNCRLIGNMLLAALCIFILIPLAYFYFSSADPAIVGMANADLAIGSESESGPSFFQHKKPDGLTLLFIGDMMFDRGVRTRIIANGANGEEDTFASTTRFLASQFDIAIGNLEGPITANPSKTVDSAGRAIPGFTFTFPPSTADLLKKSGIDIVSLANNHAGNFGASGFRETTQRLASSGIEFFGNAENAAANGIPSQISTIHCIDSSMQTGNLSRPYCIGLIGYHGLVENGEPEILAEIKKMAASKAAAANAQTEVPDFIIVFPHWGNEYQKTPTATQTRLAHAWLDAGADMIIGAHPHIVESVETYEGKPIFYSLGNYMFDQYFSYDTTHGLTLGIELAAAEDDSSEGADNSMPNTRSGLFLKKIKLMPIDITNTRVRIASDSDRTKMLAEIVRISNGLISTSTKEQILRGEIEF